MYTKCRLALLPISLLLLLAAFLFLTTPSHKYNTSTSKPTKHPQLHFYKHLASINSACDGTLYPDLCVSTLLSSFSPTLTYSSQSRSLPKLISATLNRTMSEVRSSSTDCSRIQRTRKIHNHIDRVAIADCLELLDDSMSEILISVSDLKHMKSIPKHYNDMRTLLSAAITNQYTCLDGFAYSTEKKLRDEIKMNLYNISRHVSNSLVMMKKVPGVDEVEKSSSGSEAARRLYSSDEFGGDVEKDGFPTWLSRKDRRLLQAPVNETKFDLVVAKDGTGNFTTISEAVAAAPNSSHTRFVIYIKTGAYFENVEVDKKKMRLMFIGDGIGKTVVKANRNVVDGWTTFRSATVAVVGNGFLAKGITIENSAGPSKHQAVALRSGADFSAFYQCSFVGYQDTLYVHSLRQFYRDCDIYGTVDFIFGNAAVVLQNCNLYARKPNPNQKNIFTAQGREDPNQNTGIALHNCKIAAAADLIPVKAQFKTYLGRPWKLYSRTVVMGSYIEDVVDPAGWLEWDGSFALSTLYYGEYMNRGSGSNTTRRVTWPGYKVINSSTEASQFTVGPFIQGTEWLNTSGIPFTSGLN
ncbi:Probable pectinesterase/pectinesterase inhibitor 40 [Linum grandiflorum]